MKTLVRTHRTRSMLSIIAVVACSMIAGATTAQTPAGTATISGRVVALGSGDPVANSRIILNTDPVSESPLLATSDENGRFDLQKIPAGKYQLVASHDGYVRGIYGQRNANSPGTSIEIANGQNLSPLVITLTPMGSISGTIRDRFGEPAANVAVRALRIAYRDGVRTLLPAQVARTNDLGEYRLYYLQPARYLVSALPPEGPVVGPDGLFASLTILPGSAFPSAAPGGVSTSIQSFLTQGALSSAETGVVYAPLYFPGVAELSAAAPIDLQPAESVRLADFVVTEVRAARIRGQIRDEAGQSVKGTSVALVPPGNTPNVIERYGKTTDTGTFEIRGVPPGAYDIVVTTGNLPQGIPSTAPVGAAGLFIDRTGGGSANTPADPRLLARTSLRVAAGDDENLVITLRPGYRIKGKLTIEDVNPAEAQSLIVGLTVQLIPGSVLQQDNNSDINAVRRTRSFSMPGAVSADGTFLITGAFPGTHRLAIRGASKLPPTVYVKSARMEGADVINPRFVLEHEPAGELDVVLGIATGSVAASIIDDKQTPTIATVVLVPDSATQQHYEMYFKAVSNSTGRASLENIPPGTYTAYAWESIDDGAWWDPEFLRQFEGQGKPVRIQAGNTSTIELKAVR